MEEMYITSEPAPPFSLEPDTIFSEDEEAFIDEPVKGFFREEQAEQEYQEEGEYLEEIAESLEQQTENIGYTIPLEDGITPFFKQMIEEENPIVKHILSFNLRRAKEIHSSHYEGLGEVLFTRGFLTPMLESHRAVQYLSEHRAMLVGHYAPNVLWYTDFARYTHRFALLPCAILEELSIYLGMTIFHITVRKVIQRDGVHHVRNIFGKKATDFGIRRVPLFLHNIASMHNIFSFPEYWELEDKVRESGRYALGLCISTLPKVLREEIILKLPRAFLSPDMDDPREVGPDGFSDIQKSVLAGRFFPLLRKILTLEVAPEWTPYFF